MKKCERCGRENVAEDHYLGVSLCPECAKVPVKELQKWIMGGMKHLPGEAEKIEKAKADEVQKSRPITPEAVKAFADDLAEDLEKALAALPPDALEKAIDVAVTFLPTHPNKDALSDAIEEALLETTKI